MDKTCEQKQDWLNPVLRNKKISKKHIRSINIELVVDSLNKDISEYKRNIFLMLVLARLYNKKMKLLYEECTSAMHFLSTKIQKNIRLPKPVSNNNITLSLENSNFLIGEVGDLDIVEKSDNPDFLLDMFDNQLINNDLDNFSSVEQARDASTMLLDNSTFIPKRRKEFEDQVTELCLQNLKKNNFVRRDKLQKIDLSALRNINLQIDTRLNTFFENKENIAEIENVRQASILTDNAIPHFRSTELNSIGDDPFINNTLTVTDNNISEELGDSEKSDFFNFSTLPDSFEFNHLTSKYTKAMKSQCFIALLNLATNNKLIINQEFHFEAINCTVIN